MTAWAESLGSLGGFSLPGSPRLWVKGGACPHGGGQLRSFAHAFLAGPRQVVPQPVGALYAAGHSWGFFVCGCRHQWCRSVAWPCCSVDVITPIACMFGSVPASGGMASASAASATCWSSRHERTLESPCSQRRRQRSCSGGGPIQVRRVAGVGPPPLLALPVWLVCPLPLQLHLWMLANRKPQFLLLPLGSLALVVVALGVTALPNRVLRVLVWACSLRLVLPGPDWGLMVVLPLLLRVLQKTTVLVLPTRSIWIG